MGILQELQDVGSSMTGSIHKAMLCVRKLSEIDKWIEGDPSGSGNSNLDLRAKLVADTTSFFQGGGSGIQSYAKVKATAAASGYHVLQVKYNPSSLQFQAQAGSFMQAGPGGGGVNQITQITIPSQTIMRVELLFDDVNNEDAFMWDKFALSVSNTISSAAGIAKQVIRDGYSVQAQIDGLIALITQSECRQVVFYWSELAFAGEVTDVQAAYTMFNPAGHPIRGKVTLLIRQSEADMGKGDKAYWDKAFERFFGDYSQDNDVKASKWTDSIGNLLDF